MHYKRLQFESKFFLECKADIWSSSRRKLVFSLTMMTEVGLFFSFGKRVLLRNFSNTFWTLLWDGLLHVLCLMVIFIHSYMVDRPVIVYRWNLRKRIYWTNRRRHHSVHTFYIFQTIFCSSQLMSPISICSQRV